MSYFVFKLESALIFRSKLKSKLIIFFLYKFIEKRICQKRVLEVKLDNIVASDRLSIKTKMNTFGWNMEWNGNLIQINRNFVLRV